MLDLNLPLITAQIVTFLIGFYLLWRIAYKPILKVFNQRADKIKQDLDAAAGARDGMEAARREYEQKMAKLGEETRAMLQAATRQAEQIRESIVQEARGQAALLVQQAAERITMEKDKAMKELRHEVSSLALQVAEKIIRENINPETNRHLIDEVLDQLEEKNAE